MAAIPSVSFPFKGSDNNAYSGNTVPIDPNGAIPHSAADGALVTIGSTTDAAASSDTGTFTLLALVKRLLVRMTVLIGVEQPYQGVVAMVAGTAQTAQRSVRVICTVAGNITLTYTDGSTDTIPVNVGLSYIPGAITTVALPGSGAATATFANVK